MCNVWICIHAHTNIFWRKIKLLYKIIYEQIQILLTEIKDIVHLVDNKGHHTNSHQFQPHS